MTHHMPIQAIHFLFFSWLCREHCFQFPPLNTPSDKSRSYKPVDGHLQTKLNCNLLLLKSVKINLCSPAKGQLSYILEEITQCTQWQNYLFLIKRIFFNLLKHGKFIHCFWLICLGMTPSVSCSLFSPRQRRKDLLKLLDQGITVFGHCKY